MEKMEKRAGLEAVIAIVLLIGAFLPSVPFFTRLILLGAGGYMGRMSYRRWRGDEESF